MSHLPEWSLCSVPAPPLPEWLFRESPRLAEFSLRPQVCHRHGLINAGAKYHGILNRVCREHQCQSFPTPQSPQEPSLHTEIFPLKINVQCSSHSSGPILNIPNCSRHSPALVLSRVPGFVFKMSTENYVLIKQAGHCLRRVFTVQSLSSPSGKLGPETAAGRWGLAVHGDQDTFFPFGAGVFLQFFNTGKNCWFSAEQMLRGGKGLWFHSSMRAGSCTRRERSAARCFPSLINHIPHQSSLSGSVTVILNFMLPFLCCSL